MPARIPVETLARQQEAARRLYGERASDILSFLAGSPEEQAFLFAQPLALSTILRRAPTVASKLLETLKGGSFPLEILPELGKKRAQGVYVRGTGEIIATPSSLFHEAGHKIFFEEFTPKEVRVFAREWAALRKKAFPKLKYHRGAIGEHIRVPGPYAAHPFETFAEVAEKVANTGKPVPRLPETSKIMLKKVDKVFKKGFSGPSTKKVRSNYRALESELRKEGVFPGLLPFLPFIAPQRSSLGEALTGEFLGG